MHLGLSKLLSTSIVTKWLLRSHLPFNLPFLSPLVSNCFPLPLSCRHTNWQHLEAMPLQPLIYGKQAPVAVRARGPALTRASKYKPKQHVAEKRYAEKLTVLHSKHPPTPHPLTDTHTHILHIWPSNASKWAEVASFLPCSVSNEESSGRMIVWPFAFRATLSSEPAETLLCRFHNSGWKKGPQTRMHCSDICKDNNLTSSSASAAAASSSSWVFEVFNCFINLLFISFSVIRFLFEWITFSFVNKTQ